MVACSALGALALSLGSADPAFADAIASDPPCPPNELYYPGGHQGRLCGAEACNSDENCAPAEACMKYCGVPGGVFGIIAPTTGRCTTDDECGEYQCRPMYCEVGQRAAPPSGTASRPAAPLPSSDGAGGGNSEPAGAAGSTSGHTAGQGSHNEARKVPVDDEEGCSVSVESDSARAAPFAFALLALSVVLRRHKRRSNTSSTRWSGPLRKTR